MVLAASPATVTLDRGNIPDSLMILLLVLAADSTVTAILNDRWLSAVMAARVGGAGLPGQDARGMAGRCPPRRWPTWWPVGGGRPRLGRVAVMGAHRGRRLPDLHDVRHPHTGVGPALRGRQQRTNSVYHQVFSYNGFTRVGQAPRPTPLLGKTLGTRLFTQAEPPPAWNRLLDRELRARHGVAAPAALVRLWPDRGAARRRAPRTDPAPRGALLWGLWLVVLGVVFTVSTTMNSYYAGALSPAVAGLLGLRYRPGLGAPAREPAVLLGSTPRWCWSRPATRHGSCRRAGTGQPS